MASSPILPFAADMKKKKMPGKYFWNGINSIAWFLPLLILMREHGKVWIKYLFHTHSQTQPNISWKRESKNKSIIINTPVRRTILPVRLTFSQSLCLLYDWVQIAIIFPREQLNTATNVKHKHNSTSNAQMTSSGSKVHCTWISINTTDSLSSIMNFAATHAGSLHNTWT